MVSGGQRWSGWMCVPAAILGMAFCVTGAVAEPSLCKGPAPDCVVGCLESAYAARDIGVFECLLAPDYRYVSGTEATSLGYAEEVATAKGMFGDSAIQSIVFEVEPGYTVASGEEPDTWVLSGLSVHLQVDRERDGKVSPVKVVESGNEIRVRLVGEPEPHYVIYRWWSPGTP